MRPETDKAFSLGTGGLIEDFCSRAVKLAASTSKKGNKGVQQHQSASTTQRSRASSWFPAATGEHTGFVQVLHKQQCEFLILRDEDTLNPREAAPLSASLSQDGPELEDASPLHLTSTEGKTKAS